MQYAGLFDHVVVNDQVERAAGEILSIVQAHKIPQESR